MATTPSSKPATAEDIVDLIRQASLSPQPVLKLAIITGIAAPRVAVQYDGESVSTGQVATLLSYTPIALNDRVLVATVGNTVVVLGKVGW